MGIFNASNQEQPSRSPREQEQKVMRANARNRLIGAIVLIILAIIIVPMIFKSGSSNDSENTQQLTVAPLSNKSDIAKEPTLVTGVSQNDQVTATGTLNPTAQQSATSVESSGTSASAEVKSHESIAAATASETTVDTQRSTDNASATDSNASVVSTAKGTEQQIENSRHEREKLKAQKPRKESKKVAVVKAPGSKVNIKDSQRTDDGKHALALLEGKSTEGKVATSGHYVVQIAAYSSEAEAKSRKQKLAQSGVSNGYIQPINNNSQFRLRVGPFATREAAQAAQTRLRALGYPGSFITSP